MPAADEDSEHLSVIRRRWVRSRSFRTLDRLLVIAKCKYKILANLGLSSQFTARHLSVLYPRAAPNLVQKGIKPQAVRENIRSGSSLSIADANNIPLMNADSINLLVRL